MSCSSNDYYVCSTGSFRGCCAVDPCSVGFCSVSYTATSTTFSTATQGMSKTSTATSVATSAASTNDPSGNSNVRLIGGIAGGISTAVFLLVLIILLCRRRRKEGGKYSFRRWYDEKRGKGMSEQSRSDAENSFGG